jgi:hypothetical protein
MPSQSPMRAACHCQAVKLEVTLKGGLADPRRCNCSICRMRGAVALTADVGDLRVVEGAEHLTEYRFNTGVARHWFCARCGIYTHHQRRSNPDEFGVNAACLEGVSPFDFREVPVTDGAHHPRDGYPPRTAGVLRFEPRE